MNALLKRSGKSPHEALKVYACGSNSLPDHTLEAAGYDLVLVSSESISGWYGLPAVGLLDLNDVGQCLDRLTEMTRLPMIAGMELDGEADAREAVRVLQGAGMAGMYINDRKPLYSNAAEPLLPTRQVVDHIHAAKDAQLDEDFLLVAGSGMDWVVSSDALIERLHAYSEAGADVIALEGWKTLAQVEHATDRIPGYKLLKFSEAFGMFFT